MPRLEADSGHYSNFLPSQVTMLNDADDSEHQVTWPRVIAVLCQEKTEPKAFCYQGRSSSCTPLGWPAFLHVHWDVQWTPTGIFTLFPTRWSPGSQSGSSRHQNTLDSCMNSYGHLPIPHTPPSTDRGQHVRASACRMHEGNLAKAAPAHQQHNSSRDQSVWRLCGCGHMYSSLAATSQTCKALSSQEPLGLGAICRAKTEPHLRCCEASGDGVCFPQAGAQAQL